MRRLLIRPGAIGDCIVSLPALESLQAEYTEVWVAGQNVPLIRFADRVRSIASTGLDLLGIPGVEPPRELLNKLASFGSIVSWYGSNRLEFREAVKGLPFQFFPALPPSGVGVHAVDFYLAQARSVLGSVSADPIPRIPCAVERGEPFAVIHPFSGSAAKNWPLENFRELSNWLKPRIPVRWCAGPSETLDEAVRIDDLYQLANWLRSATIYVGNDSGITHLAAAVGLPTVAIFGSSDPAVWSPRGQKVLVLNNIRMENVKSAIESWL